MTKFLASIQYRYCWYKVNDLKLNSYFITCPKGIEILLADELTALGADSVKLSMAGVYAMGDLTFAYRVCLWSRLANRVLYLLAKQSVDSVQALYDAVFAVDWQAHMD